MSKKAVERKGVIGGSERIDEGFELVGGKRVTHGLGKAGAGRENGVAMIEGPRRFSNVQFCAKIHRLKLC